MPVITFMSTPLRRSFTLAFLAFTILAGAQPPETDSLAQVRLVACGDLADTNVGAALAPEIVAAFYRAASWSPERATTAGIRDCRIRRVLPHGINSTGEARKTRARGAFAASEDFVIPGGRIEVHPDDPPHLLWAAAWELKLPRTEHTVMIERFPYFEGLFPISMRRDPAFAKGAVQYLAFYRNPAQGRWDVQSAQSNVDGSERQTFSTVSAPTQWYSNLSLETACCASTDDRAMPEAEALAMAKATLDAKTAKEELDALRMLVEANSEWSWAACRAVLLAHALGEPEIAAENADAKRFAALLAGATAERKAFCERAAAETSTIDGWMADTLTALDGAAARPLIASVGRW